MLLPTIISRLKNQHDVTTEMLMGHSTELLKTKVQPGKWSIYEQVAHLAAYQPTFYDRLSLIHSENNPSFERYVADNDPHFHECCTKELSWLLEHLNHYRSKINEYLLALSEQELKRTGLHPRFGVMTVEAWTEFFLLHEAHHQFSIFMLAREMNI